MGRGGMGWNSRLATYGRPSSVAVADFNGDLKLDLATANSAIGAGGGTVNILFGNGMGGVGATEAIGFGPWDFVNLVTAADLNGDHKPELVLVFSTGSVNVVNRDAMGKYHSLSASQAHRNPSAIVVGDWNGDQNLDLAVTSSNDVSVLLGDGKGGFSAAISFAVGFSPSAIATGDFNGDHRPDLVVANSGSNTISVLINQSQ